MVSGHLLHCSRASDRGGEAAWHTRIKTIGHFNRDVQTSSSPLYAMPSTDALEATLAAHAHPRDSELELVLGCRWNVTPKPRAQQGRRGLRWLENARGSVFLTLLLQGGEISLVDPAKACSPGIVVKA